MNVYVKWELNNAMKLFLISSKTRTAAYERVTIISGYSMRYAEGEVELTP